jgi:hypothetical protein
VDAEGQAEVGAVETDHAPARETCNDRMRRKFYLAADKFIDEAIATGDEGKLNAAIAAWTARGGY